MPKATEEKNTAAPDQSIIVAIDAVLLTLDEGILKVALHQRDHAPFERMLALPGGYIHPHEDDNAEATAFRVLLEKTRLKPRYLEQLGVYSGNGRDPRGWSMSASFVGLVAIDDLKAAGDGVFSFWDVDQLPEIAFDHNRQVNDAVRRVRNKSSYSTLPCWLLPDEFTLTQLQQTYEAVLGKKMNRATFRSRLGIKAEDGPEALPVDGEENKLLLPTDRFQGHGHRHARLYRVNSLNVFNGAAW